MSTAEETTCEMIPLKSADSNFAFHLPGKPGEGVMPCVRDREAGTVTSFWTPAAVIPRAQEDDDAIAIHVVTYGFQPQVEIGFGKTVEDASFDQRPTEPYTGWEGRRGFWCGVLVDDRVRAYLEGDGLFVLRVHMCPPPPVSVWIA